MAIDIVHFGRFAPGYKDYSILDLLAKSGLNVHCWLSGNPNDIKNHFQSTTINLYIGVYCTNVIKSFNFELCILPYRSCTQSGVLVEAIDLGFIPIVPDLECFHEFLPPQVFSELYYTNQIDLPTNIMAMDFQSNKQYLQYLRYEC